MRLTMVHKSCLIPHSWLADSVLVLSRKLKLESTLNSKWTLACICSTNKVAFYIIKSSVCVPLNELWSECFSNVLFS